MSENAAGVDMLEGCGDPDPDDGSAELVEGCEFGLSRPRGGSGGRAFSVERGRERGGDLDGGGGGEKTGPEDRRPGPSGVAPRGGVPGGVGNGRQRRSLGESLDGLRASGFACTV
jgi:hypothetical protein